MSEGKNQIQITAIFDIGDNVDSDLLLESVEAACGDMLYDKDAEDQRLNWGDFVRFNKVFMSKIDELEQEIGECNE